MAVLVSAMWGGNVVALKLGLTAFAPFWSAFWRMALGVAALGAYAWSERVPLKPRAGETGRLALLGALFTVQISLLNIGTSLTSPAYAVVLLNSHPIFANLAGHFVEFEPRLNRLRILGLALAFGGVCVVAMGKPPARLAPQPLLGNALLIGSAMLLGVRGVYTRGLVQSIEPTRALLWQVLFSLPAFLLLGAIFEAPLSGPLRWQPVLAIAYQGVIVAGLCFIAWTTLLRRHSAGTLSMFAFTVPFFGMALSALLFGEELGPRLLLGAAAVTAAILIVTVPRGGVKRSTELRGEEETAAERST
jgi:drug/metabolite transporter (DMT)-like permease